MVRGDILTGLRNALERGQDINSAKRSFVNAGYSINEVEEASRVILGQPIKVTNPKEIAEKTSFVPPPEAPQIYMGKSKKKHILRNVFLSFLGLVIIAGLGWLITWLFQMAK